MYNFPIIKKQLQQLKISRVKRETKKRTDETDVHYYISPFLQSNLHILKYLNILLD